MYHQMTLEEFLFGPDDGFPAVVQNTANTRTYSQDYMSPDFKQKLYKQWGTNPSVMLARLKKFNDDHKKLHEQPRRSLYREFYIPKHSGGLRKIDAPNAELMSALRELKTILEDEFHCMYHTSAFAYVKKRSTIDAIKRHQSNESKWFAKFDLSNFFGSTTLDFVMSMFSQIFPITEIVRSNEGKEALRTALDLAFLDGGLPQGTPISPTITNIMMIPIDFRLTHEFRDFKVIKDGVEYNQHFVYTRYADDFLVSSQYAFSAREVEAFIVKVLAEFNAPFSIKREKTRYGSSAGSNWNLGVMLNKDNKITVGHKKKRQFQSMLHSFIMDTINGKQWELNDVQVLEGYRSYYRMVERDAIDGIIKHINEKHGVDVVDMIKKRLNMDVHAGNGGRKKEFELSCDDVVDGEIPW